MRDLESIVHEQLEDEEFYNLVTDDFSYLDDFLDE